MVLKVLFSPLRHFLKSPNFDGWFRTRRREMIHKLEALHLEALCEEVRRCQILLSGCGYAVLVAVWRSHWSVCLQDLQQRVQKHSEVETVDLVLKLKDKLVSMNSEMVYCIFYSYFTSSCCCVCVSWVTLGLFGGHKL